MKKSKMLAIGAFIDRILLSLLVKSSSFSLEDLTSDYYMKIVSFLGKLFNF